MQDSVDPRSANAGSSSAWLGGCVYLGSPALTGRPPLPFIYFDSAPTTGQEAPRALCVGPPPPLDACHLIFELAMMPAFCALPLNLFLAHLPSSWIAVHGSVYHWRGGPLLVRPRPSGQVDRPVPTACCTSVPYLAWGPGSRVMDGQGPIVVGRQPVCPVLTLVFGYTAED